MVRRFKHQHSAPMLIAPTTNPANKATHVFIGMRIPAVGNTFDFTSEISIIKMLLEPDEGIAYPDHTSELFGRIGHHPAFELQEVR